MAPLLQRKYIDLIHEISSKWVNWDPPIQISVGTYGTVDRETGNLVVEGNIYDAEFLSELEKQGLNFNLANHTPLEGPVEGDFIITSIGAEHRELNTDSELDVPGLVNATIKGQWAFKSGKRGAVLIMHKHRLIHLPPNVVLEHLYKVDKLIDKWLVTGIHVCPAYSMYLSDTTGDKITLALAAKAPIAGVVGATAGAQGGIDWWADAKSGLLRKGCDQTGNNPFTPLYSLRRPIKRKWRLFRDSSKPDPTGDDLWVDAFPPWDPLDEEGEEDPLDSSVRSVGPFQYVYDKPE